MILTKLRWTPKTGRVLEMPAAIDISSDLRRQGSDQRGPGAARSEERCVTARPDIESPCGVYGDDPVRRLETHIISHLSLGPGTRFGVYQITAHIGEGGMGQVYRATDIKLKRQVAIKILPPSVAADHDRLARFQREAEVLASLNHPHIAAIYGLQESADITGLVMELVEGEDLSQRLARGVIRIDEALPIARQIADALEAAHEQGIIHRDLKPRTSKCVPTIR